jgi:hypothetical protein
MNSIDLFRPGILAPNQCLSSYPNMASGINRKFGLADFIKRLKLNLDRKHENEFLRT